MSDSMDHNWAGLRRESGQSKLCGFVYQRRILIRSLVFVPGAAGRVSRMISAIFASSGGPLI